MFNSYKIICYIWYVSGVNCLPFIFLTLISYLHFTLSTNLFGWIMPVKNNKNIFHFFLGKIQNKLVYSMFKFCRHYYAPIHHPVFQEHWIPNQSIRPANHKKGMVIQYCYTNMKQFTCWPWYGVIWNCTQELFCNVSCLWISPPNILIYLLSYSLADRTEVPKTWESRGFFWNTYIIDSNWLHPFVRKIVS